jgi:hypothetical protein
MFEFIGGAICGCIVGVVGFKMLLGSCQDSDCINCPGLIERDADIRALTRSRDLFRNRCDQLEVQVHGLRSKNGALSQEVQRFAYFAQKEA